MREKGVDVEELMEEVNSAVSAPETLLKDLWRKDEGQAPNIAFLYPPFSRSLEVNLDLVSRNWEIESEFPIGSQRKGLAPLVVAVKRTLRRLLHWYINPIVYQIRKYNMLATRTMHDLANNMEALEERIARMEKAIGGLPETPSEGRGEEIGGSPDG